MNGKTKRSGIVMRAGFAGMLCNLLLFLFKLGLGLMAHSVSVLADAFNNLSDAASSLLSLFSARLSEKAADERHPFGHGRAEYVAAFVVSFLVLEVGVKSLEGAVSKIFHPELIVFRPLWLWILGISILAKLAMGFYYRSVAHRIDSALFLASSADSFQDALITGSALLSMLIYGFFHINADPYVGLLVSLLVIWNGIGIARETLEPLLGQPTDAELCRALRELVESYPGIYGSHDLILHNYGPEQYMGTIHVEVDGKSSIAETHELVDQIERRVKRELGVRLVIHMDPRDDRDETLFYRGIALQLLSELEPRARIHDFRISHGEGRRLFLRFDLWLPWGIREEQENQLMLELSERMREENPRICCSITLDHPYSEEESGEKEEEKPD